MSRYFNSYALMNKLEPFVGKKWGEEVTAEMVTAITKRHKAVPLVVGSGDIIPPNSGRVMDVVRVDRDGTIIGFTKT